MRQPALEKPHGDALGGPSSRESPRVTAWAVIILEIRVLFALPPVCACSRRPRCAHELGDMLAHVAAVTLLDAPVVAIGETRGVDVAVWLVVHAHAGVGATEKAASACSRTRPL